MFAELPFCLIKPTETVWNLGENEFCGARCRTGSPRRYAGDVAADAAQAIHNGLVDTVFSHITKVRNNSEWGLLKGKSATPERRVIYQREHWALLVALRNRDADTARAAVISHLINVRGNMFD
jgi:FCD domain